MTNGIVQIEAVFCNGFAVKDFDTEKIVYNIGYISFPSYEKAVESCCGRFYPPSYQPYLVKVNELITSGKLQTIPDADIWENLIYADDYRGVYDGERKEWRNVTSMDKGAATEDEIDYVDALASTYKSLLAMVEKT